MKKKEPEGVEKRRKMSFTFNQLRELNTASKTDYINKILEEDNKVSMYIKKVHKMVEDVEDQLFEQQMGIEDTKDNFNDKMVIINQNLKSNAI